MFEAVLGAGATGVTVIEAQGTGVRQRIGEVGEYLQIEKAIIQIVVSKKEKNNVFNKLRKVANLDKPGWGIAFIQPIEKVKGYIDK